MAFSEISENTSENKYWLKTASSGESNRLSAAGAGWLKTAASSKAAAGFYLAKAAALFLRRKPSKAAKAKIQ